MKGTINQDAKTLESRANSIRVSAILKKYTMVIALVVVFIFFTALTGGKMLYAQNISNLSVFRYPRFQDKRRSYPLSLLGFLHVFRLYANGGGKQPYDAVAEVSPEIYA